MKIVHGPSESSTTGLIETIDGRVIKDVDVIIFATAYTARFEFLQETDAPFTNAPITKPIKSPLGSTKPPSEKLGTSKLEGGYRMSLLFRLS